MKIAEAVVHYNEVDEEWFTQILTRSNRIEPGIRVASVRRDPCGTGQLGDSFRFHLTYEPDGAGPSTIVGKFPSESPVSREFSRNSGYYRNEIRFYNELAPGMSVAVPKTLHAALAENETDFVLLMEDLAPARAVDQMDGCTAEDASGVIVEIAALHAAKWRDSTLAKLDWLQGPSGVYNHVIDNFGDVIRDFPSLAGDLVSDSDIAVASEIVRHAAKWKQVLSDRQCLWHTDIRSDNVLFDVNDGARPTVILDWQGLGFGPGTLDVSLFLATSMSVEDRRANERDLMRLYHSEMEGHGVDEYSWEETWDAYRLNAVHGLQVGFFGLGAVKRTPRGDEMWRVWIERAAQQVRDLGSISLLANL